MKKNNYKIIGVVFSLFLLVICTTHSTSITYNNLEKQISDELTDSKLFNPQLSSNIKWAANGTIICNETYDQELPQICSDGLGGAIITWLDTRGGIIYPDIYAQRIDSDGYALWDANGTVICDASWPQEDSQICSDGAGGAIITWEDFRSGGNHDIYAQRIDSDGNIKWTINGEEICTEVDRQGNVQICSDGVGGAILVWEDWRSIGRDVYAQRIDSNGNVQWTVGGVAICTAGNIQWLPQITSDGVGGAIITWIDYRSGLTYDIYAQRINSTGSVMWGSDVPICTAGDTQAYPQICSDGAGGAIISWVDNRNISATGSDIYAQRVHQNGSTMWTVNGEAISINPGTQLVPQICSDGNGGAIITWYDNRSSNNDIYAQKVDSNGIVQWTLDGEAICTESESQLYPEICSDEHGGAIVTWRDYRNGVDCDVYAQWIDSNGIVEIPGGFPICTEDEDQFFTQICSNGTGGAIIVWEDHRGISEPDIYAQFFITPEQEEDGSNGENAIPFGEFFLFFTFLSVLSLILFKKSRYSLRGNK